MPAVGHVATGFLASDAMSLQGRFHAGMRGCPPVQRAGRLLADEGDVQAGQVGKQQFLAELQMRVLTVAREVLGPLGMAQDDCPDLQYWIAHYDAMPAAHVEEVVARYAPATQAAATWQECLSLLVQRIRQALLENARTGAVVDPEPAPVSLEQERPPLPRVTLQKKRAPPLQMKCFGSPDKSASTAEAKRSAADVEAQTIALVRRKAEALRQAYALGKGSQDGELRVATLLWEAQSAKMKALLAADGITTVDDYIKKHLSACSGVADTLSDYLHQRQVYKPRKDDEEPEPDVVLLQRPKGRDADAKAPQDGPGAVAQWQLGPGITSRGDGHFYLAQNGHYFTLVALNGKYDLYESDANHGEPIHMLGSYQDPKQKEPSQSGANLSAAELRLRLFGLMPRLVKEPATAHEVTANCIFTPIK